MLGPKFFWILKPYLMYECHGIRNKIANQAASVYILICISIIYNFRIAMTFVNFQSVAYSRCPNASPRSMYKYADKRWFYILRNKGRSLQCCPSLKGADENRLTFHAPSCLCFYLKVMFNDAIPFMGILNHH